MPKRLKISTPFPARCIRGELEYIIGQVGYMNTAHPLSPEREAQWQRHTIVALWILIALLIAITAGLLYGRAHGLFQPSPERLPSVPSWPVDS